MPLDPQAKSLLDAMAALAMPDITTLEPAAVRERMALMPRPPGEAVARVEDRTVPGPHGPIGVRIYAAAESTDGPVFVYFHGGGWVLGSIDGSDNSCRALANASGGVVVSVDYRLAPEHRFPVAPDDCFAATQWVAEHAAELRGSADRIVVTGDSAGGNLAAVVALMARERGGPSIAFQGLIYPVTDYSFDTPSYTENGEGYMLSTAGMRWFWGHYAAEADALHPFVSPLRAPDLSGLPPALVITAEFDPLRDEGAAYAERLRAAGVAVEYQCYEGMIHGFFGNPAMDRGRDAVLHLARAARAAVGA